MKRALTLVALALVLSPLAAALARAQPLLVAKLTPDMLVRPLETSLAVGAIAALTALALGVPWALLVCGTRSPARRPLLILGVLALGLPPYLAASAWIDLFGPAGRITGAVLSALGVAASSPEEARLGVYRHAHWVYTAPAAGLVLGACLFPIVGLAVAAADRRLDRRVLEAARLARGRLGALRVALGALGPVALGAALLVFAFSLTESAAPRVLYVGTLAESVHTLVDQNQLGAAAALGLGLALLVLVLGAAGILLVRRRRVASTASLEGDAARFELRPSRLPGAVLATLVGLLVAAPGLVLPIASFVLQTRTGVGAAFAHAWGTAGGDARRTALLAAVTASVATLVAAFVGRPWRGTSRIDALVVGLVAIGLAIPAPVVGLGLILLWNHAPTAFVYDGPLVVALGWLARFLAIPVLIARAAFARVPVELEEAAALAGHGPRARAWSILLPLAAPGLAVGWLAFYVLAVTEYGTTVLVYPPGEEMLAPTVVNLVHYGQEAKIAAAALLLLGTVALPAILAGAVMIVRRK